MIAIRVDSRVSGAIIKARALGVDRADKTQSVTFTTQVGGGVAGGALSKLAALSGATERSSTIAGASGAITRSGGFMSLTVTGVAGKTIDWIGKLELLTI